MLINNYNENINLGMYNSSDVKLHWEPQSPVTIDRPDEQLTEFALVKSFYNESVVNADLKNLRHGAFSK